MDNNSAVQDFKSILDNEPNVSPAVAALRVLLDFMVKDTSETLQGLEKNIKSLVEALNKVDCSVTSVKSACELFMRFITLTSLDHSDFEECKKVLSQRGTVFLNRLSNARHKIAKAGQSFIVDDINILIHSHSRVVYETLIAAFNARKRFHVYVTESAPDFSGKMMFDKLEKAGLSCTLILDAAVSYVLEKVDLVFLGAEGIVESGGIINKIGTYNIAICAKELNKPVYVLAESFKFLRLYPLNQRDLPNELKHLSAKVNSKEHPLVDYTPPAYITLLFSDLGILTPSVVSDELIKLYM
ncbi:translation initiation factor eIF2B subunit alpha isoform X1 [Parasteatoda tepidariorum]|uniref:translation initiation factor eIF2B subunit alpha isoform X2 n=1 Tax=Parasteatoda tepidariorum TaxID=114398 RepID=UPI00077FB379|nr:translation initiation factor eIF-2B subunit alpha [Parasteatoda tepidariorum]